MRRIFLISCLVVSACGNSQPDKYPSQKLNEDLQAKYDEFSTRLLDEFQVNGWVVSKDQNGALDKLGDSLLFTGLAIGSLDCEKGKTILKALYEAADKTGGFWERFLPLPTEYESDPISLDGEIGVLWGMVRHFQKCGDGDTKQLWIRHARAVLDSDNKLHPTSDVKLVQGMDYPWRIFSYWFDQTHEPDYSRRALFHNELVAWAAATVQTRSACYRVHLAQLSILTAQLLDRRISNAAKNNFCDVTSPANIPLTDWYCGRLDPDVWLLEFEPNKWEYQHQRCASWESPDMDSGAKSPAVDWLLFYDVTKNN